MSDLIALASLIGPISIVVLLVIFGKLSYRLGRVMHASPYYIGFYVAASMISAAVVIRVIWLFEYNGTADDTVWTFIYYALFASGVTVGLVIAWRYWSWLLAERD
jgi:hypothetical protein